MIVYLDESYDQPYKRFTELLISRNTRRIKNSAFGIGDRIEKKLGFGAINDNRRPISPAQT